MTDPEWDIAKEPPTLRTDLTVYPLDDDLVVYDSKSGQSFVLNSTGRIVWSLCDGERSPRMIAEEFAANVDIPYDQARTDVKELLDEFRKSNLLLRG